MNELNADLKFYFQIHRELIVNNSGGGSEDPTLGTTDLITCETHVKRFSLLMSTKKERNITICSSEAQIVLK